MFFLLHYFVALSAKILLKQLPARAYGDNPDYFILR